MSQVTDPINDVMVAFKLFLIRLVSFHVSSKVVPQRRHVYLFVSEREREKNTSCFECCRYVTDSKVSLNLHDSILL